MSGFEINWKQRKDQLCEVLKEGHSNETAAVISTDASASKLQVFPLSSTNPPLTGTNPLQSAHCHSSSLNHRMLFRDSNLFILVKRYVALC